MSELILNEPLASQIRQEAEAQGVDVEVFLEATLKHYRFGIQRQKINAEAEWWQERSPEERAQYTGEFVAVHNQEVVDHDRDEEVLRKRIRATYGKTAVLLTPAEGRREIHFISTHLA